MPADHQTLAQARAIQGFTPPLAPRRRRVTRCRPTLADVLARRAEIKELLQTPAAPARRGEPSALAAAAALSRKFPLFSLRAEKLFLRLAAHLPADGTPRTFPLWRIQAWAGDCSPRTARTLVRELTLTGVLPLIAHRPGREGRSGSYGFVRRPFELLVKQHRERQGIIDRREQLRETRLRRRAEGSTAAACQRVLFNANWLTRKSCTADETAALELLFPPPPTTTVSVAKPLPYGYEGWIGQKRAQWSGGLLDRYTPRNSHWKMTVTVRREPPLVGSGQSFADAKAAALEHLEGLRQSL